MRGNDALYATIYSLPVKLGDDSSHTGFGRTCPVRCRDIYHLDQAFWLAGAIGRLRFITYFEPAGVARGNVCC